MRLFLQHLVPFRQPRAFQGVDLVRNASLRARMVILWKDLHGDYATVVESGLEQTIQYAKVTVRSITARPLRLRRGVQ